MSYTRVNWNSTTTYVSAENLNVMDKGIKDLDTNVGDVAVLKTTAKTVVPAINELSTGLKDVNNNFGNYISKSASVINGALKDIVEPGSYGYASITSIPDYPSSMSNYIAGTIFVQKYGNYKTYKIIATNNAGSLTKSIDGFLILGLSGIVWGTPY